jgi:hypothetical protein
MGPDLKTRGTHRYVYGPPLIGSADASSSIIGLHRQRMIVATLSEIGELKSEFKSVRGSR